MGVVKNLMVRAGADFSPITKQANKASQSMRGMQKSFSSAASGIKRALGAVGIAASLTAIVAAAKECKEAFAAQEEAEAKLAQVMRNTMSASSGEVQSILKLTQAQQALGVIGDEVQLAGAQELATYTSMTGSLERLIPVMNDMVAQQYGYSASAEQATQIATMLGKVLQGQTGALSRYGYYFDEAQERLLKYGTEEQRVATLADVVEQSVGGMNAALAQTPTGQLKQLSNTIGDIKEQFGAAVTTVAAAFVPALNTVCSALSRVAALANQAAQAIANVFGKSSKQTAVSFGSGVSTAAEAAGELSDAVSGAGNAAKKAVGSLAGFDRLNIIQTESSSGGSGGTSTASGGGGGTGGAFDYGEAAAESAASLGVLERALRRIKAAVDKINWEPLQESWGRLKESAGQLADRISEGLGWAWDNVLAPIVTWGGESLLPAVLDVIAAAIDVLTAAIDRLKPFGKWLWENFLKPLGEWTGERIIQALGYIKDKLSGLADLISGRITLRDWLNDLSPLEQGMLTIGVAIGAVSLALTVFNGVLTVTKAVTGAVTSAIKGVKGAIALLSSPVGIAVVAIAGLVAAGVLLYQNWDKIKEGAAALKDAVLNAWNGLKDGTISVFELIKATVRGIINDIISRFEGWVNAAIYGINALLSGAAWVARLFGGGFSAQISYINLPRFASGGFPDAGQVFLAREKGPELVGTMGGRTAVANNMQIVEGITSGVAEGNRNMVNVLYRLLEVGQALLDKDGSVVIAPSAALGRTVSRSLDMYGRTTG